MARRTRPRQRRRRWSCTVVLGGALFVLLGGLVIAAPHWLFRSPLKEQLLARATHGLDASFRVGDVSTGWFSPLVVRDLAAVDATGTPLLEVGRIRTHASLLDLLLGWGGPVAVTVEEPHLHVSLRPDGSNLEDAISEWTRGTSSRRGGTFVIKQGTVGVVDTVSGTSWSANGINAQLELPLGDDNAFSFRLQSNLQSENQPPGAIAVEAISSAGRGKLKIEAHEVVLHGAESLLRRWDPACELAGIATGKIEFDWNPDSQSARLREVVVRNLAFSTAAWPQQDRLHLLRAELTGTFTRRGPAWQIRDGSLRSDLARLDVQGQGTVGDHSGGEIAANVWEWLPRSDVKITGTVDLAQLAQMIPGTLRLHAATQITAGSIAFAVDSQTIDTAVWSGQLDATGLAATHRGQPFRWDDPLQLSFHAQKTQQTWLIDQLACRASFLDLTARGSIAQGNLEFEGDLTRFADETGKILDLGDVQLAGHLRGSANWQQSMAGPFEFDAVARADDFVWHSGGAHTWREDALELTLSAKGATDGRRLQMLDAAVMKLQSGTDDCQITLTESVAPVGITSRWPLRVQLAGSLKTWLARLHPVLPAGAAAWQGRIDLEAAADVDGPQIAVTSGRAVLRDFVGEMPSFTVREPRIEAEVEGRWNRSSGQASVPAFTLVSSSLALRGEEVHLARGTAANPSLQLSGKFGYRADLQRLSAAYPAVSPRLGGHVIGHAQFSSDRGKTKFDWQTETQDFAYIPGGAAETNHPTSTVNRTLPSAALWSERLLKFGGRGTIEQDHVWLEQIELAADAVRGAATGSLHDVGGAREVDLHGEIEYDLEKLSPRLAHLLGIDLQLVGRSSQPFRFRGPLPRAARSPHESAWSALLADAKLAWTSAEVEGVAIGPGTIETQLREGLVTLIPLELSVSDGRLFLSPTIDLRAPEAVLTVPPGKVAETVRITPDMCHSWLKYVTPLVADATTVEGRFSLALDASTVPLRNPAAANVKGDLHVHSAQLGPGTLTREFLFLVDRMKALLERRATSQNAGGSARWLSLPEQHVTFHLRDRRVYHEGLQMKAGEAVLFTRGSVGLDQSLELVATVPIPEAWVAGDRWLSALAGQSVEIPLGGTLEKPQFDLRALDQLAKQLVSGSAARLLEQELGRGLDRLLRPRQ